MQGVEILTSHQVAVDYAFNTKAAVIIGIATFAFCFLIVVFVSLVDENWFSNIVSGIVSGLFAGIFLGVLGGAIYSEPSTYKMQYEVVVSDEVSISEFTNKYEIIKQDGKIYTVEERTEQ